MRSKGKFYVEWISVNDRKVPPKPKCMPVDMSNKEWVKYFVRFERDMIPAQTRTCTKSYPFHVLRWVKKNSLRFLDLFDRGENVDSEPQSPSSSSLTDGDGRSNTLSKVKAGPFRLRRARTPEDDSSEWSNTELDTGSESESSDWTAGKRTPVKVAVTGRRPRGRPKGSKAKNSFKPAPGPAQVTVAVMDRRPRGRPKGSKGKKLKNRKFAPAKNPMMLGISEWARGVQNQARENRLRRRRG